MKKILIVSYYELKESLRCAADCLENCLSYEILHYPLFEKKNDTNSRIENYFEDFISFIKKSNPDILFWWYFGISEKKLKEIKSLFPSLFQILYNWDDPFIWDIDPSYKEKVSLLDACFISCKSSVKKYENECHLEIVDYCLPGFDLRYHFPEDKTDETYASDISICCTNLYENENIYSKQFVNRKKLLDYIYDQCHNGVSDPVYTFRIYGPDFLGDIYPKAYKGYCSYYDTHKVFYNSKVNICTHVISNAKGYLSERVSLILGSSGFLLIDPIDGLDEILKDKEHCVYMSSRDPSDIWKNDIVPLISDDPGVVEKRNRMASRGHAFAKKNLTWKRWAKCFDSLVSQRFFDEIYSKTYNRLKYPYIMPYRTNPPVKDKDFDWKQYVSLNHLNSNEIKNESLAWCHWCRHGKKNGLIYGQKTILIPSPTEIVSTHSSTSEGNKMTQEMITIFNTFKMIQEGNYDKLFELKNSIIKEEIDDLLEIYLNMETM